MNDYSKQVKIKLIERGMTQKQLTTKVREATGLKVDSSYLCKILAGSRHPAKVIHAINEILGI